MLSLVKDVLRPHYRRYREARWGKIDLANDGRDTAVGEKIADAEVIMSPFPHIVVQNVFPNELYETLLKRWPNTTDLPPEPGGLGRYRGGLISANFLEPTYGEFWLDFSRTTGQSIISAALSRFSEFNTARFGADAQYEAHFGFFESGATFAQHGSHTHFNHGPSWAMTFLLFMEDGERTDRGEVFSAPSRHDDWLDIVSATTGRLKLRPAKRIPFTRNTLLAWLDGPMSFHGTDDLPRDANNRRRIFRAHTSLNAADAGIRLGFTDAEFQETCRKHAAGDSTKLSIALNDPEHPSNRTPRFTFSD